MSPHMNYEDSIHGFIFCLWIFCVSLPMPEYRGWVDRFCQGSTDESKSCKKIGCGCNKSKIDGELMDGKREMWREAICQGPDYPSMFWFSVCLPKT